jgi:hypothetical protein
MRGGHVDALTRKSVAGWAADSDRPDARLIVAVLVDGVKIGEAQADRLRRDLASLGRFGDGCHGFAFEFPEPLDAQADHVVRVQYAEDGVKLPNGEQRLAALAQPGTQSGAQSGTPAGGEAGPPPAPPAGPKAAVPAAAPAATPARKPKPAARAKPRAGAAAPGLAPILVTAPGRSGTTLLMGLLAKSPAIVAAELVPYELRLLSYYAAAYQVLTAPADLDRSTHPDRLEGDGFHIGFNPFNSPNYAPAFRDRAPLQEYFASYAPDRVCDFVRDMVGEYYTRLAADKGKTGARFFAEKGNNLHAPTRHFTRRVFGQVRELVIVRDPRDVLCSHMAYFSSSPEKAFAQLSHAARQLLAIRAEAAPDIHIFKYEDMVRGDPACFAGLSDFLGTKIAPEGGFRPQEVFRKHGTSVSPEASVARWRTNLPEDLRTRCAQDWAGFLGVFGYELA